MAPGKLFFSSEKSQKSVKSKIRWVWRVSKNFWSHIFRALLCLFGFVDRVLFPQILDSLSACQKAGLSGGFD